MSQNKDIAKTAIRRMPVWEYEEEFGVEVKNLKYDLDSFIEKLNQITDKFESLSKLNPPRLPVRERGENIKIYKKIEDEYREQKELDDQVQDANRISKNMDPLRDESVRMLEQKVQANEEVYAMLKTGEPWVKCRVYQVFCKPNRGLIRQPNITFRLKETTKEGERIKDVNKYSVARIQYHSDNLRAAKRVIAGFNENSLLPGIIGYEPCSRNKNRYLVLMDDGSADYFKPDQVFPILGQSATPWSDSRYLNRRAEFNQSRLRYFFNCWPRRNLLQDMDPGTELEILRNEEPVKAFLVHFDEDIVRVRYTDDTEESLYRGSLRLMIKRDRVQKLLNNVGSTEHFHANIQFNLFRYRRAGEIAIDEDGYHCADARSKRYIVSRNHNTARKSTSTTTKKRKLTVQLDGQLVNENTKKIRAYDEERFLRSRDHKCTSRCLDVSGVKTELAVKDLIEDFMNVSALKIPLLLGWKRSLHYVPSPKSNQLHIAVVYEAPCGKLFQQPHLLNRYLITLNSKFDIDYFTFDRDIQLNRKVGEFEAKHYVENIAVDKKTGKPLETKYISLLNRNTEERLPIDFEYRNESFPHPMLLAKGFSFNEEFKSSCDCEDDCLSRANACPCHINNADFYIKGTQTKNIRISNEPNCQYKNKRLLKQVNTGIFECNSGCSCSSKCGNRVVQNGIKFRLQVYKTLSKGWGVITLDDIPQGAFICTYAAELLDDADMHGTSDMYYADLDFISINEAKKLGLDDEDGERFDPDLPFIRLHDYLDSHDYTLDARIQGNVGRFFNHSCDPNAVVQTVFIETHDLRFPIVAFFSTRVIKASEEITWNYNYKLGSIVGRRIECHCGASNCEGRIL